MGVYPETLVAGREPMNTQCVDGSDDGSHITDAFARSLFLGVGLDGRSWGVVGVFPSRRVSQRDRLCGG